MAVGSIVNGQCIDFAAAPDLAMSQIQPSLSAGADTYLTVPTYDPEGWLLVTYKNGDFFSSTFAPALSFAECDTTQTFNDGMQLGWAVAAAMVFVYVIRRVYR